MYPALFAPEIYFFEVVIIFHSVFFFILLGKFLLFAHIMVFNYGKDKAKKVLKRRIGFCRGKIQQPVA